MTTTNNMRTAAKCYNIMLITGMLDSADHPDLYREYQNNSDVQTCLDMMAAEEPVLCRVIHAQRSGRLYLVPEANSPMLLNRAGYKTRYMSSLDKTIDVYVEFILILFILNEFYGGKNAEIKQRAFLTYDEIISVMDEKCRAILSNEERLSEAKETGLAFEDVARAWAGYSMGEEELSRRGKHAKNKKYGVLLNVIKTISDEGMFIVLRSGQQIRPTSRLDDLMESYYLTQDNIEVINSWVGSLAKEGETNGTD